MHLYKQKKDRSIAGIAMTFLLFFVIFGYFLYGFSDVSKTMDGQQEDSLKRAVNQAVTSCYAIEGAYPDSISYIEKHYGVVIDHSKYIVTYQSLGSNIKPDVQIHKIGGE